MGRKARAQTFARRIVAWQRVHGRQGLPWQAQSDPYRVWLSEIMLQQTQVTTARAYFERFVQVFPDVASLARAPLDDVLALWSGLGYYTRARNLHRCAREVVEVHGGTFPAASVELAQLPGIGRSTAAAIAAFCHGERAAILDGNVKRVLARHLGFDLDLAQAGNQRALWLLAQDLLPGSRLMPAYTQGLMDLGATLCLARNPDCPRCPVRSDCVARLRKRVDDLPVKSRRIQRGARASALLWLQWRKQLVLVRRPERGVWAGLWSLPEFDTVKALRATAAGWAGHGDELPPIDHTLTHLDWRLSPVLWQLPARTDAATRAQLTAALPGARWFDCDEALAMSLPAPVRRLIGAVPAHR